MPPARRALVTRARRHSAQALAAYGWHVLRFNNSQVHEEMAEYRVPSILDAVNQLGGVVQPDEAHATIEGGASGNLRVHEDVVPYLMEEDW